MSKFEITRDIFAAIGFAAIGFAATYIFVSLVIGKLLYLLFAA
ncbi:hypothetical protein [Haloferula sp. A504]